MTLLLYFVLLDPMKVDCPVDLVSKCELKGGREPQLIILPSYSYTNHTGIVKRTCFTDEALQTLRTVI